MRRILESYFRRWLSFLVVNCDSPVKVVYRPAPGLGSSVELCSQYGSDTRPQMEIDVTSPAFYTRFVHYAHSTEAFDREFLCTDNRNRTITVSDPRLLTLVFAPEDQHLADGSHVDGMLESLRWAFLRNVRCPPASGAYPEVKKTVSALGEDIRPKPYSSLDRFVMNRCSDAALYRRTATKLFLSQKWFFGLDLVVTGLDVILRFCMLKLVWSSAFGASLTTTPSIQGHLLLSQLIHAWAALKGF